MRRNIFGAFIIAGGLVLLSTASSFAQHGTKPAESTKATLMAPGLVTVPHNQASTSPTPAPKATTKPEVEKPESTATGTEQETQGTTEVETPEVDKPGTAQHDTGTTDHQSETETGDRQD